MSILKKYASPYKDLLLYGFSLAALLIFLSYIEYRWLILSHQFEIYAGVIAILFTLLGIWLATKLISRKKEIMVVEKEVFRLLPAEFTRNDKEAEKLGLSRRELEVLELIAQGLSNQEIAERLFVSLNTIKTHNSNILEKLQVKRRTMAVSKAKSLNLIP
jgi:DNA-binding CsgD family transcriptional regulator